MAKKDENMNNDLLRLIALVDKKSAPVLEEWSRLEGRSMQSHNGILLRRLARLYRECPDKLQELGLLTPLALHSAA